MSVPTLVGAHAWLDAFLGDDASTAAPATFHVALLTGDPRDTGVEVTGAGYARVTVANTTAVWGTASAGQKSASAAFADPTGTWTVARWWAAAESGVSDDWCMAGQLSETVAMVDGDTGPIVICVVRVDREW